MLLPPAVSALLREGLYSNAIACTRRGVDEGDPVSLAVLCVCETIVRLRTGRLIPGEVSSALIPILKASDPPSQASPSATTDPASKPFFFDTTDN